MSPRYFSYLVLADPPRHRGHRHLRPLHSARRQLPGAGSDRSGIHCSAPQEQGTGPIGESVLVAGSSNAARLRHGLRGSRHMGRAPYALSCTRPTRMT